MYSIVQELDKNEDVLNIFQNILMDRSFIMNACVHNLILKLNAWV